MNRLWLRRLRADEGQATVEVVALVPIITAVALLIGGFLAAHRMREAADGAAVAAAIAQLQGRDVEAAARAAAPGWTLRVEIHRGAVHVRVRWRGPRVIAAFVDAERSVAFASEGQR